MSRWTHRVRPPGQPQELQDLRHAAQDLAQQAEHHAPGRTGIVFRSVSDILILASAGIAATLGLIHLCKALTRTHAPASHSEHPPEHQDRDPSQAGQHHEQHHTHGHHGRG